MMIVLLILQAGGAETTVNEAPNAPISSAMVEATANRARVKTGPMLDELKSVRPRAAVEAGEFGEVAISGIVGPDGRFREPKIKQTSRSTIIDAAALADVPKLKFSPARDANGKPLSIPVTMMMEFEHVEFRGPNGLNNYRCAQAVKDYAWWNRNWPSQKKDRIFATVRGMAATQSLQTGRQWKSDFAGEWNGALEQCRSHPGDKFLKFMPVYEPWIAVLTKGY